MYSGKSVIIYRDRYFFLSIIIYAFYRGGLFFKVLKLVSCLLNPIVFIREGHPMKASLWWQYGPSLLQKLLLVFVCFLICLIALLKKLSTFLVEKMIFPLSVCNEYGVAHEYGKLCVVSLHLCLVCVGYCAKFSISFVSILFRFSQRAL